MDTEWRPLKLRINTMGHDTYTGIELDADVERRILLCPPSEPFKLVAYDARTSLQQLAHIRHPA